MSGVYSVVTQRHSFSVFIVLWQWGISRPSLVEQSQRGKHWVLVHAARLVRVPIPRDVSKLHHILVDFGLFPEQMVD